MDSPRPLVPAGTLPDSRELDLTADDEEGVTVAVPGSPPVTTQPPAEVVRGRA